MKCPICNSKGNFFPKSFLPHYIACLNCGSFIIDKPHIVSYPKKYFDEGKNNFPLSKFFEFPLNIFLSLKVNSIERLLEKKDAKILDYGCGSGKLLLALVLKNYKIIGFEPSKGALKITQKLDLPVYSKVKKIKGGYDLIMFWHSLEHTENPYKVIKKISKLLAPNGKIIIAIPNADSWDAKLTKDKWFHYTYPLHKIHFTPHSITYLLEKCGLEIEEIDFFNIEYTFSGLIQSILNLFLPMDVLYSFVAHRRTTLSKRKTMLFSFISISFIVIFSPIILLIYLSELLFKKTDAILIRACMSTKNAAFVNQKT